MKVLIVEDELTMANYLVGLLNELFPSFKILPIVNTVEQIPHILSENHIDILFLDIHVGRNNSIDFLRHINLPERLNIIITSAHDNYALEAFDLFPFHYLLKPIDEDDLQNVVNKLLNKLEQQRPNKSIRVKTRAGWQLINQEEIYYCKAEGAYTYIHLDNKSYTSSRNLKYFEEELPSFFRTHHSYLVNTNHVKSIQDAKHCILTNGIAVPVSSRKRSGLNKLFK